MSLHSRNSGVWAHPGRVLAEPREPFRRQQEAPVPIGREELEKRLSACGIRLAGLLREEPAGFLTFGWREDIPPHPPRSILLPTAGCTAPGPLQETPGEHPRGKG